MDRETYLREHIVSIAEDTFPDDVGLEWPILAIGHRGDRSAVTVEPRGDVGYRRFIFLVSFEAEQAPRSLACYADSGDGYFLLCTAPGVAGQIPKRWPPD